MKRDSFLEYVLDQLRDVTDVEARSMFGGHGLYRGERFFGITHRGRLYFRVDDKSRGDYEGRGMKPFRPSAKRVIRTYYEVPAEVIERANVLAWWAERAVRIRPGGKK